MAPSLPAAPARPSRSMLPIVIHRQGWGKTILRSIKDGLLSHSLPRGLPVMPPTHKKAVIGQSSEVSYRPECDAHCAPLPGDGLSGCVRVLTGRGRNAEPTRAATGSLSEICTARRLPTFRTMKIVCASPKRTDDGILRSAIGHSVKALAACHGSPNVAIRSIPHTNSTRFSSIFGSRRP